MNTYITLFLAHMELRRAASQLTLKRYREYLDAFMKFSKIEKPEDITEDLLKEFSAHLDSKNLAIDTKNLRLTVIRSLLKYLATEEKLAVLNFEKVPLYRKGRRENLVLPSDEDLARFLAPVGNIRDDLIVRFLFDSGMRIAELIALNCIEPKKSISINGKGGAPRIVYITPQTLELWKSYVTGRAYDPRTPLFINLRGHRVHKRAVQQMITDRAAAVGIRGKFSAHTLRHLFATNMLRAGANIYDVKSFLGHSSITTTERYLHLTNEHLESTYDRIKSISVVQ